MSGRPVIFVSFTSYINIIHEGLTRAGFEFAIYACEMSALLILLSPPRGVQHVDLFSKIFIHIVPFILKDLYMYWMLYNHISKKSSRALFTHASVSVQ
jgi:hypothetical protein